MKRHHILFRGALASLAAVATLAIGCGSGLLDTEDEKLEPTLTVTLDSSSSRLDDVCYGDVVDLKARLTLTNAHFSEAFAAELQDEGASVETPFNLEDYFTLRLVDSNGATVTGMLEELSLYATSFVTVVDSKPNISSGTYTNAKASFDITLTLEFGEDYKNKSAGRLVITSGSATGRSGLSGNITTYSVAPLEDEGELFELPMAGQIITAASNITSDNTIGVTVINLPVGSRVNKAIKAGETIGRVTLGGEEAHVQALTAVSKKSRRIPVIINGAQSFTFAPGTIAFTQGYVTNSTEPISIDADLLKNIAVPYYGEDYSSYTLTRNANSTYYSPNQNKNIDYEFITYGRFIAGGAIKETPLVFATWKAPSLTNEQIVIDGTNESGPRGMFTYDGDHLWTENPDGISYPDGKTYIVEFDMVVTGGDTYTSELYLYNKEVTAEKAPNDTTPTGIDELKGLYLGNYSDGLWADELENYVWAATGITSDSYHYKFVVAYSSEEGKSKITPYINGEAGPTVADVSGGGDIQGIAIQNGRGKTTKLDNIVVYGLGQ